MRYWEELGIEDDNYPHIEPDRSALQAVTLFGGEKILAHKLGACGDWPCCVHAPTDHVMVEFRQHWRSDRQLMERVCPHGIGHPDPDHLAFIERRYGKESRSVEAVHGCDGCCRDY